ncbi:MAG TPA: YggS family pyridoxal phosphate-dependent enzyme [Verrucomicrobiae bacterium]|nr:YggS family pyridoxal phosphate-dependent enzyme [Verrucomicrobiae bacterium]
MDNLQAQIQEVRAKMAAAARRGCRQIDDITLVAVSKTVPPERVDEALALGVTTFGESKLQEAKAKIPLVSSRARWHMIGHLQTNKARVAVELFELIHSVDSVKLAADLNKWAERVGKTQAVLLEINVSGEPSKFGIKPEDLNAMLDPIVALPRLEVRGLMTLAPFAEDAEKARPYFRRLRELRDAVGLRELSMGMSNDFEIAVEEGATIVRVGTAIFGERKHNEPEE